MGFLLFGRITVTLYRCNAWGVFEGRKRVKSDSSVPPVLLQCDSSVTPVNQYCCIGVTLE